MAEEVKLAFGMAVRVARMRKRYSQRQFALMARIDRAYLSKLEAGKADATIEVQYRIAQALGTTVTRLWEKVAVEERESRRTADPVEGASP